MARCDSSNALSTLSAGRFTNRADSSESRLSNSSCSRKPTVSSIGECCATLFHLGPGTVSIRPFFESRGSKKQELAGIYRSWRNPKLHNGLEAENGWKQLEIWPCDGLTVAQDLIPCNCDVRHKMVGLKRAGFNPGGAMPTFPHSALVLRSQRITG